MLTMSSSWVFEVDWDWTVIGLLSKFFVISKMISIGLLKSLIIKTKVLSFYWVILQEHGIQEILKISLLLFKTIIPTHLFFLIVLEEKLESIVTSSLSTHLTQNLLFMHG